MVTTENSHQTFAPKPRNTPIGTCPTSGRQERRLGVTAPLRELGGRLGTAPGRVLARRPLGRQHESGTEARAVTALAAFAKGDACRGGDVGGNGDEGSWRLNHKYLLCLEQVEIWGV